MRGKFYFWLGIYAGLMLIGLIRWSPNQAYNVVTTDFTTGMEFTPFVVPLFISWINFSGFITLIAALFGGVDLVSDEVDKNTLSFLLTKPISRTRIYLTKLLLNVVGLTLIFGLSSGVVLFIDQLQPQRVNLLEALGDMLSVLTAAIIVIFLSGLISVFTRNTLQTIAVAVAILLGVSLSGAFVISKVASLLTPTVEVGVTIGILGAIGLLCGLFWSGLIAFNHKEF
ncbi:MAG: ABC transporter permease [Chloroflexi bacterium]|nr:ABC transporter permease [Chloroflexota bacterium]